MDRQKKVDRKDLQILEVLQTEGRIALSELGRKIGLSQPAISERVKRLEDTGIITGYTAKIDPRALGLGLTAIIRVRTTHEQIKSCLQQFEKMANIIEVHRVTGEDCFVLKVIVPQPEDLEVIVDRIASFGPVTTSLILRSEPSKPLSTELLKAHRN